MRNPKEKQGNGEVLFAKGGEDKHKLSLEVQ